MKSDDLYTAAFLAALPVCLAHYYRFATDGETYRESRSLLVSAVDEAHTVAVVAREKWLAEKEKTRRRGGRPE